MKNLLFLPIGLIGVITFTGRWSIGPKEADGKAKEATQLSGWVLSSPPHPGFFQLFGPKLKDYFAKLKIIQLNSSISLENMVKLRLSKENLHKTPENIIQGIKNENTNNKNEINNGWRDNYGIGTMQRNECIRNSEVLE